MMEDMILDNMKDVKKVEKVSISYYCLKIGEDKELVHNVYNFKVINLVQIKNMKINKIYTKGVKEVFFIVLDGIQDY